MTGTDPVRPRAPRADALRNRARILEVARAVVEEQGAQASLRDIARRAEVGMGTLYRHFATREELLEALLRRRFDHLAGHAAALEADRPPAEALAEWLRAFTSGTAAYRGLATSMMATIDDESSPLHASCGAMRAAGARLLRRAQDAGAVRPDVDGLDLFALVGAVSWIADQTPTIAARRDHLFALIMDGLAHPAPTG
ncbi:MULTISPECIES: TetR/AcrR family transcriptional regulator [Streptosporangium]|uniref:AcrR family transcriptional regulator n=1 Tax=Streptosporangium brasiliense TaxID=47480 RepID=A0ABT9RFB9_9ACTN|nr:TetR/AcrR family transcriptional regulator [Streptosporangium brasiliense]MDP9867984.1 AcrR family transcriptional regulator [Streptosporangium brasiliense]